MNNEPEEHVAIAPVAEVLPPEPSSESFRRMAVERLAEHLTIGAALLERCQELAAAQRGDRLGPMHAAARLMQANAKVADALAHVAQIERRRRSIIERIQPVQVDPKELILKKMEEKKMEGENAIATLRARLQRLRDQEYATEENPYREGTTRWQNWEDERREYRERTAS